MNYNEDINNQFSNGIDGIVDYSYNNDYIENASTFFKDGSQNDIGDIISHYNQRQDYLNNLVKSFGENNSNIEEQILELYANVKNLIENRDVNLIKNSIESIKRGKENAMRFITEQRQFMDDNTLHIMNVIIDQYSNHLNYLNQAINILE